MHIRQHALRLHLETSHVWILICAARLPHVVPSLTGVPGTNIINIDTKASQRESSATLYATSFIKNYNQDTFIGNSAAFLEITFL